MESIESVLEEPPENSLFGKTVNPISTGCLLYKVVDDICNIFNLSKYNADKVKDNILD